MSQQRPYYRLGRTEYDRESLVPRDDTPPPRFHYDHLYYRKEVIDASQQAQDNRMTAIEAVNSTQDAMLSDHGGRIITLESQADDHEARITALENGGSSGGVIPVYNVKNYGAVGDGVADDAPAIQQALDAANLNGGGIVYVPEGVYAIAATLNIYSNTTLWCSPKTTIRRESNAVTSMLRSANLGAGGYDGVQNVTLRGGVWDHKGDAYTTGGTVLVFGHCRGVTVENVTVLNTREMHCLELNAVQRARVINCVFDTQLWDTAQARPVKEAIQIDLAKDSGTFPPYGPYDNTPCDDVLVMGCTFKNWSRGVGSHNFTAGFEYTNIRIIGNHFENISDEAVRVYHYRDCVVKGNTFKNVLDAIQLDFAEGCVVTDNTVDTTTGNGINIYEGTVGTVVAGNTFRNVTGQGISIYSDAAASRPPVVGNVIAENTLIGIGQHGINFNNASRNTVVNNRLENVAGYGLLLQNGSSDNMIHGNYLENCRSGGVGSVNTDIRLQSSSNNNTLQGNVVRNSATPSGIEIASTCSGNWITNNDFLGKTPNYGTGNTQTNNRT